MDQEESHHTAKKNGKIPDDATDCMKCKFNHLKCMFSYDVNNVDAKC